MFARGVAIGICIGAVLMCMVIITVGLWSAVAAQTFDPFDCAKHGLVLNTISRHIDPGRKYNEKNYGLSYECRRSHDPRWGWQGGYYKNSFNRDTWYAVVAYQPWMLLGARFGGFAGAGTGYREHEKDNGPDVPRGGLSPLVGALLSVEDKEKGLNLIVGTSVVFAQVKVFF